MKTTMHRLIGALAVCLLLAGCSAAGSAGQAQPTEGPTASDTPQNNQVIAEAVAVPLRNVELRFSTNGVVAAVLVREGDRVEQDAPLAQLDARDQELALKQARAALAKAQAGYEKLKAGATPAEIAAAQAQAQQAQAQLRQTSGSVTRQDIVAAQAQLNRARAAEAQLRAGPKSAELQAALADRDKAVANLQSQRDSLSAAKTDAQLRVQQAASSLTEAQSAYATALQNWQYVQSTGNDPITPKKPDGQGKEKANKLSDSQRQQYYDAFVRAEAGLRSAELTVQQAQVVFDNARQTEISGIQAAEAQVRTAQASLDQIQTPADADKLAAARAEIAAAQANLDKLRGEQRAGSLDAANAQVSNAEANLSRVTAPPAAADLASAQAQVQEAEVTVAQAALALEKLTLRAPFAGTIAALNLDVGQMTSQETPALVLADMSNWQIETSDLTELSVVSIKEGDAVRVSFDALPGVVLAGTVDRIRPLGEKYQGDMTYKVVVGLKQADPRIRWNMSASITIDK